MTIMDERGIMINEHLERSNSKFAGNVLAEVWSSMDDGGQLLNLPVNFEHANRVVFIMLLSSH